MTTMTTYPHRYEVVTVVMVVTMGFSHLWVPRRAQSTFDGSAVKSAFALLSQKVTKARCFRSVRK